MVDAKVIEQNAASTGEAASRRGHFIPPFKMSTVICLRCGRRAAGCPAKTQETDCGTAAAAAGGTLRAQMKLVAFKSRGQSGMGKEGKEEEDRQGGDR